MAEDQIEASLVIGAALHYRIVLAYCVLLAINRALGVFRQSSKVMLVFDKLIICPNSGENHGVDSN